MTGKQEAITPCVPARFEDGSPEDGRIRRIRYYEELFHEAAAILDGTEDPDAERLAQCIRELDAYYTGPVWREDFEADEAGELPADLRRGVLSEDGIYDLLQRYQEASQVLQREDREDRSDPRSGLTMRIRRSVPGDHARIMEIYRIAQDYMIASGNPSQWGHMYPQPELIRSDIEAGVSYVLCDEEGIHGVFAMFTDPEPTYSVIEDGAWLNDEPYVTIHRVAGDGTRHGIVRTVIDYARSLSDNIRIDTHADNATMQHQIENNGFIRCGTIHLANGAPRIAYQWTR